MEKQKILWIILSVTLLVVIVLASGIYFLKPTKNEVAATAVNNTTGLQDTGFDTYEYVRNEKKLPGLEPAKQKKSEEMTIVVGEKDNTGSKNIKRAEKVKKTKEITVTINKTPVSTHSFAKSPKRPVKKSERRVVKKRTPRTIKEYWIQAASYSSLAKAEALRDNLSLKGVASRILTKEINGKTYYRVRIGPYSSKAEAEKFLGQIKKLKGLAGSYISVVYVKKY